MYKSRCIKIVISVQRRRVAGDAIINICRTASVATAMAEVGGDFARAFRAQSWKNQIGLLGFDWLSVGTYLHNEATTLLIETLDAAKFVVVADGSCQSMDQHSVSKCGPLDVSSEI